MFESIATASRLRLTGADRQHRGRSLLHRVIQDSAYLELAMGLATLLMVAKQPRA